MTKITELQGKLPALQSNTVKHGILGTHFLLQWEDISEYEAMLTGLHIDYIPVGATELHMVEELAGIIWRKRRLKFAETAYYLKRLESISDSFSNSTAEAALVYTKIESAAKKFSTKKALSHSDADNRKALDDIATYREPALKALAFLQSKKADYHKAMKMLANVTREWWLEEKLGEEISPGKMYEPCTEHLHSFLLFYVVPFYNQQYEEITHRKSIKQQAESEAFIPGDVQERFNRYEVHLDRKFERILTVLLRLQEIRKNKEKALLGSEIA